MSDPVVVTTVSGMREAVAGRQVALVPTMGALHEGHLALVQRAGELADVVAVSIFVNPLQFGDPADLARYPRTLDDDLAALADSAASIVFAPDAAELYPRGDVQTRITGGTAATRFEGRSRPGHFDGVLTVVAKLLHISRPVVVLFGQKDAQQAFLVGQMVRDLDLDTRVEVVPTVRDADGLALSSRNRFLGAADRRVALTIPRALEAAASASDRGLDAALAAAQGAVMGEEGLDLDYLAVVDPRTFAPVPDDYRGAAIAIIAARVGSVRLIDNERLTLS